MDGMGKNCSGPMDMMMQMTFYSSTDVTILFNSWQTHSVGSYVGSMFAVFVSAIVYEYLKKLREKVDIEFAIHRRKDGGVSRRVQESDSLLEKPGEELVRTFTPMAHLLRTFLHMIHYTLAMLNMLVFMTFNVGLCVAMVLGSSVGFALTSRTMDFGSAAGLSADCHV